MFIEEYYRKIKSGEIIAPKRVIQMYEDLYQVAIGNHPKYYLNEKKGARAIRFMQTFCKQSKGEWAGKPLELMLFQRAKNEALFGILDRETHKRRFKEVFDLRGRKNGKTTEQSAIALYMLSADGEEGAEVYSAADAKNEARRIWDEAKNMVFQSEELQKIIKPMYYEIKAPDTFSTFKVLGRRDKSLYGLNSSCAMIDEAHALSRELYDLLKQSQSTREQPLLSAITTSGFIRGGLFDDLYSYCCNVLDGVFQDDTMLILLYEQDDVSELDDPNLWIKSNPALGVIKSMEYMTANVERAKNDLNFRNSVLVKDFNIIGVENKAGWDFDLINNETEVNYEDYKNIPAIGGFDLSRTGDLTAWNSLYYDKAKDIFICETMYWITEKFLEDNASSKVPYKAWLERGLIRIAGKTTISYQEITKYVLDLVMKRGFIFPVIHYDAYSATYLVEDLEQLGFTKGACLKATQQGFKTLSVPLQTMEQLMLEKKLVYNNNPITKWCMTNVELVEDRNGNLLPSKANRASKKKIDGVSAILNTMVGLVDNYSYFVG